MGVAAFSLTGNFLLTGEVDVLHRRVAKSSILTDKRRFGMGVAAFSLNLDFSLLNREADVLHRRGCKKEAAFFKPRFLVGV